MIYMKYTQYVCDFCGKKCNPPYSTIHQKYDTELHFCSPECKEKFYFEQAQNMKEEEEHFEMQKRQ